MIWNGENGMLQHSDHCRRGRRNLLIAVVLLLMALWGAAEGEGTLSFRQMAEPVSGAVTLYSENTATSTKIAQVEKGTQCEIIGTAHPYYLVRAGEVTGYAKKSLVTVETLQTPVEESLCDTLSLTTATPGRKEPYLSFQGTLTADGPLEGILMYIWDERQARLERSYVVPLERAASRIDATVLNETVVLKELTGGRKTLVVEGCTAEKTAVLFRSLIYVSGKLAEAPHVTEMCGGLQRSVLDDNVDTAWTVNKKSASLTVTIPEKAHAALMTLEWKRLPDSFLVEMLDENGQVLAWIEKEDVFYLESIPLSERTRKVVITRTGNKAALGTLRVYAEGYSTRDVQEWKPLPDKIDILLISTHQDDEFLFFGGTIPYYAAREDVTIGVLYMADCGRPRYREALEALWCAGLKQAPIFLGMVDYYPKDIVDARNRWRRDDPAKLLTRVIRQYQPEVILCQDLGGEYGHGQHQYTAELATESLTLAADAEYDPESAEQWGTWQVKKCYVHLYGENQIRMDWNVPLDDTGVITPMFLAREAFDRCRSQQSGFSMDEQGVLFDNTLFGLYWSTVGPDLQKNDFMENIK